MFDFTEVSFIQSAPQLAPSPVHSVSTHPQNSTPVSSSPLSSSDFNYLTKHLQSPHFFPPNVGPALSLFLSYSPDCSPLSLPWFCPPPRHPPPPLPPVLLGSAWPSLSRWKTCLAAQWSPSLGDLRRRRLVSNEAVKLSYVTVFGLDQDACEVNSGERDVWWAGGLVLTVELKQLVN